PHLTEYVLDTALAQVARWRAQGLDVPVAVNVSPRDVHTPGLASGAGHGPAGRGTTFTDLAVLILDAGPDPAAYGRDRYPSGRVPAP
ncbi:hypothetical protein HRW09_36550, partial [Streptomyces lunaelactis]|uniref:hypothetical protein n=1 Tax=Streptomyces lunaelactis TaxID=1535768 RepID=UPI0015853C1F